MANSVTLNENDIIEITVAGDQSGPSVQYVIDRVMPLIEKLHDRNKPILVLCDVSKIGKSTASSRRLSVEVIKMVQFEKAAQVGANSFTKQLINLTLRVSGQSEKVRFFDDRGAAIDWLLE